MIGRRWKRIVSNQFGQFDYSIEPFLDAGIARKNDLNFKELRVRISLFHSLHSIAQGAFLFDGSILHCPVEM